MRALARGAALEPMTRLKRTVRVLGIGLALLVFLAVGGLFVTSWVLERLLDRERVFDGVTIRFHDPDVSLAFALRADSVVIDAPAARWTLVRAYAGMDYWGGLTPALAVFGVRADSIAVTTRTMNAAADTTGAPLPFPAWLRFPVGLDVSWRTMTVHTPGGALLSAGPARIKTQGPQALRANVRVATGGEDDPSFEAVLDAGWRGRALRYRFEAVRAGHDTLTASGARDKQNLRLGRDTVVVVVARPGDWHPAWRALREADTFITSTPSTTSGTHPVVTAAATVAGTTATTAPAAAGVTTAAAAATTATVIAALDTAAFTPISLLSSVRVEAHTLWRHDHRDSLRLAARFVTAPVEPLSAVTWNVAAQLGDSGGTLALKGRGARQTVDLAGRWSAPDLWHAAPRWELWRGDLTGTVRGGTWTVADFVLPLDFDVTQARIDTGLRVTARVRTGDASLVDLRWNGRLPGRLELSGDVARGESWAVNWTDGNIDYEAARVAGVWENSVLTITARVREPRAYGNVADSLVAENQVTSAGYFLRRGLVYRNGEVFTGDGQVLWENAAGEHDVSLRFEARNPRHGTIGMSMRVPGPLVLTADSLWPARFPYEPLRRLAMFDPWIDGSFRWDEVTGDGGSALRARFTGAGAVLDADLDASWSRDSARVRRFALSSGGARLTTEAVIPFDGRTLQWSGGAQSLMGGVWRVEASGLETGDVWSLARRSVRLFHGIEGGEARAGTRDADTGTRGGVLNGALEFSAATGMKGVLRLDQLRLPAATGLSDVTAVEIVGLGDSLRADASLAPGPARWNDTLFAAVSGLNTDAPRFRAEAHSSGGLVTQLEGSIPGWRTLEGSARARGRMPLPEGAGSLEDVSLDGILSGNVGREFLEDLKLTDGMLSFRHVSATDTQNVRGQLALSDGVMTLAPFLVSNSREETLRGQASYEPARGAASLSLYGTAYGLSLPGGAQVSVRDLGSEWMWSAGRGLSGITEARAGFVTLPAAPSRVEGGFENLRATVTLPPAGAAVPPALKVEGRLQDFFFQRRWGWRDVTGFFTGIGRGNAPLAPSGRARARPWDLDINLEAVGTRNRIDTDVLRMNFTGDARLTGVYPYLLVNGKVSGLQGEVGQSRQAYSLRDFEVKWDNVTLEDGALYVEGEKRVRADCRVDTRQTCQIYIRLDGRLEDIGFTYETDCTQGTSDPVSPSVLINSMAQGCYVAETPGGEGNYGSAAFAMLEPALNDRLSRGVARSSGGFIKSTQVSGLSALIGSDSSGLESVALEVESRRVYRTSLKGRAGYHPETKLANPMEYRLAAEYRPPLERVTTDSVWQARLKDRFTVEAAVETRPEGRDIDEERRVRQRAGLRYRYRFWNLW